MVKTKNLRKRTAWLEHREARWKAHDGRSPLTRDWREGEPQVYVRSVLRRLANPSFSELYMATVYKRCALV